MALPDYLPNNTTPAVVISGGHCISISKNEAKETGLPVVRVITAIVVALIHQLGFSLYRNQVIYWVKGSVRVLF